MNVAPSNAPVRPTRRWVGPVIFTLLVAVVVLVGLLGFTIMERRWEATRPVLVVRPVADFEPDNAKWGENYPREYESYMMTKESTSRTKFGGSFPRDYLEEDPYAVILFAGYGFSKDFKQARGHFHAVEDAIATHRIKTPYNPGTCWTCKSPDVPRLMKDMGVMAFYGSNWHDLKKEVTNPIGCQDCHDPKTMNLHISRPALKEALASQGKDIEQATHQEMRSLVCAQCHVEYYFQKQPKDYLKFPWDKGMGVEEMISYYEDVGHNDWVHPISKTPMIKAQHPDFEMWSHGVHAYRGVSCADCHMPYKTEGAVKFTDHHVQSPLLNIANSCAVCHRWSEDEIKIRVNAIQDTVWKGRLRAEEALVKAHFDIGGAMQAGLTDEDLTLARGLVRGGQFRWDYVAANNGMGFHAPQESMRILQDATDMAEQARLAVAKALAVRGVATPDATPDISTRTKAFELAKHFVDGTLPKLMEPPLPAAPDTAGADTATGTDQAGLKIPPRVFTDTDSDPPQLNIPRVFTQDKKPGPPPPDPGPEKVKRPLQIPGAFKTN